MLKFLCLLFLYGCSAGSFIIPSQEDGGVNFDSSIPDAQIRDADREVPDYFYNENHENRREEYRLFEAGAGLSQCVCYFLPIRKESYVCFKFVCSLNCEQNFSSEEELCFYVGGR